MLKNLFTNFVKHNLCNIKFLTFICYVIKTNNINLGKHLINTVLRLMLYYCVHALLIMLIIKQLNNELAAYYILKLKG